MAVLFVFIFPEECCVKHCSTSSFAKLSKDRFNSPSAAVILPTSLDLSQAGTKIVILPSLRSAATRVCQKKGRVKKSNRGEAACTDVVLIRVGGGASLFCKSGR